MAVVILGCSTPIPGLSAIAPTANPSEEVSALAADVESARAAELDVLAPSWFEAADDSLDRAQELLSEGGAVQSILSHVAQGHAALGQATTFAAVSKQTLPEVIQARRDALAAGGASLGTTYDQVEARFLRLTAAVESDSLSWARRTAPSVEKAYRSVELSAIKQQTVARIQDLIEKAREAGAAQFAPDALADAEEREKRLDRFISRNRYATEAIGEQAAEVLFYANRLVHLTEEAKQIDRRDPQQLALQNEATLAAIAQKLEMPDIRNQSPRSQVRQIENAIDRLLDARHDLQARVDRLRNELERQQGHIAILQTEAASLEDERIISQRVAAASAIFEPGEAEVYRQGSQVVIRLRSIHFPVGSSVILPEDYPVLAKVQRAIETFDRPRVVVEGHTDSTGSAELNDRLSQDRADAVVSYLVNNHTVEANRVSAVGKGFSEPLASDRTAEGRAQNRRIDVRIETDSIDVLALSQETGSRE